MITKSRQPPRVFVSYACDSERHRRQVHEFAWFLRASGGIDVRFDLWDAGRRRDWSAWIIEQVREADFVLVLASPAYKRRAEDIAESSEGYGVQFEAALLRDLLAQERDKWIHKVLPVVLPGRSVDDIPMFLQPHVATRYVVIAITMEGIDELYRVITGQPRHRPPDLGRLVIRPATDQAAEAGGERGEDRQSRVGWPPIPNPRD
jgi:hypothetical protein